jgi:hypothetical protein
VVARGLVRNNNLSDLPSPEQARINLGLNSDDYNQIRGLYVAVGLRATDVQRIARSASNYQGQIDTLSSTLSGIVPSNYIALSGDTITGDWTNHGFIQASTIVQSGTALGSSSDALFTLTVSGLSFALSTSTLTMNSGVTVQSLKDNGAVVFTSGVTVNKLVPMKINGIQYFLEAG